MQKRRVVFVIFCFVLWLCLSSLPTQVAMSQGNVFWRFSPKSSFFITVQAVPDVSGDGHEDVFVATSPMTRYSNGKIEELPGELIFLDGKTGQLKRSLNLGKTDVGEVVFVNGRVMFTQGNAVEVYDSEFNELHNKTFIKPPRLLTPLNSTDIILATWRFVTCYSFEANRNRWIWVAPDEITGLLITSNGIVCAYPDNLALIGFNGRLIQSKYVPRPKFSEPVFYAESLHRLDDSRFLYLEDAWVIFGQSPNVSLSMWETNETAFEIGWKIDVGGRSANKPYAISDVDNDTVNDFICVRKEDTKITVFSGKTGQPIYATPLDAYYIHAAASISDIDNDGIDEMAINPYSPSYFHDLYITSFKDNRSVSYVIASLDLYDHLVPIEDINGDGFLDIIGSTLGGRVIAYRGFAPEPPDTTPPTVSVLFPQNKTYRMSDIPLRFTLSESVDATWYSLDGEANETFYGDITIPDVRDGAHTLVVYARDLKGNIGKSSVIYFSVDTTAPHIEIFSPENKTYATRTVPLRFKVNEPVSYVRFGLDGQFNTTIDGNATLSALKDGTHSIVLYADDSVGNTGTSEKIYFTVDARPPEIEVMSPKNMTYSTDSVSLTFIVDEPASWTGYSLDGQANQTIHDPDTATISNLAEGQHQLTLYATDAAGNTGVSHTIYFSVNARSEEFAPRALEMIVAAIAVCGAVISFLTYVRRRSRRAAISSQTNTLS